MEFVNNTNFRTSNQGTPARRTPISNDITQFLQNNTPGSSNSPTPNMNNTGGNKEKKNAKVKRSEIDDDIEMLEEDSDADDIAIVSDAVETPSTDQQPTSSEKNQQEEIIDITADNDDDFDDIVPIGAPASCDSTVNPQKMTSIKQTIVDDDIEMIEEDDPNQQPATSPLPYNTAETPSELQRPSSIMSETHDHSRIVLSSVNETHGDEAINNVSNDAGGDPSLNTAAYEDPSPALNKTPPVPDKRSSSSTNLREVFAADWKYGYDKCGKYSKRIIVFESNDRNYAREYGNSKECKRCHGCFRTGQKIRTLKWQNETRLFVPTNHICKPRLYSEIEREQREFAEKSPGRSTENNGRGGKRSRIDGGESLREESETAVNHDSQQDANADNGWNEFVEPSTPPANVDSVNPQPVASPLLQSPSPPLSVVNFPESNDFYSFRFYHPSGAFLDECCEKLELDYQIQAYQFWANISLTHIRQDSIPRLTHTTVNQEMSGFSSLSLLFTGSEGHAGKIKNRLNKYFSQNSVTIGGIVGQNLSQTFNPKVVETIFSADLTDIHFVTLAHLLACRIALFKNGAWKRFGKWTYSDSGEYVPVILLESKIGKYSPIFSC